MAGRKLEIIIEGRDRTGRSFRRARDDVKGLQGAVQQLQKTLSATASRLDSFANRATLMGGIVGGILAGVGGSFVKMASDAVETENLFKVSMGEMESAARQFSQNLSQSLGLNETEVQRMIGTFNVMISSMGLGRDASFEMSKGLTQLAFDMSSFFNLKPEEAFEKLRAGITGEVEPLKQLGIVLSETEVEAFALRQELIKQGQEMSEAQKIVARYGLLLERTSAAQGDLARTMDSPANQLRRLEASFADVRREIGEIFLPVVSGALTWINDEGMPRVRAAVKKFQDSWAELSDEARRRILFIGALLVAGGPLLKGLSVAMRAFDAFARVATSRLGLIILAIGAVGAALFQVLGFQFAEFLARASITLQKMGLTLQRDAQKPLGKALKAIGIDLEVTGEALRSLGSDLGQFAFDLYDVRRNVEPLDEALKLVRGDFSSLEAAAGAAIPVIDQGLAALEGTSKEHLVALADEIDKFIGFTSQSAQKAGDQAQDAGEKMIPPPNLQNLWNQAATAMADAGNTLKEKADEAGVSVRDLTQAMIAVHPATAAAAAAVGLWQQRIAEVNLAIQANRDQLEAAQRDLRGMQEHLNGLNQQLSEAQRRFQEFASAPLKGMGQFDDQIFAVQQQLNRIKLAENLGVPLEQVIAQFPLMDQALEAFLSTLPKTGEELQAVLERLQLERGLTFDEQVRALQKAAEGAKRELTFEEALRGINETKAQIDGLTGAIQAQEAAIRNQQAVIESIQLAGEALNATLAAYQEQLRQAEANQRLVTQALQMAFEWFLKDREEIVKMGPAGVEAAKVIDEATVKMLGDINQFTQDVATGTKANLADVVKSYEDAVNAALAQLGRIPREIEVKIRTVKVEVPASGSASSSGGEAPGFQHGGSFVVPGVGGPDSQLVAFRATPGERVTVTKPGQAMGAVNVVVNVQGSVIAERDLARTVREELIRMGNRNVDIFGGRG